MTITDEVRASQVRSIAIIGGGASGAIALDALIQEGAFNEIVLFERRGVVGGVWVLDEEPDKIDVPPGVGQDELDPPITIPVFDTKSVVKSKRTTQPRFEHTASYKGLRTNIPEELMTYSDDRQWPTESEDERVEGQYVKGSVVHRYIEKYFTRHYLHIVFRTTVESVTKDYSKQNSQFELTLRTETDEVDSEGSSIDEWTKRSFDAIVVATGHYHIPWIPDVPGIQDVYEQFPKLIEHSKTFRSADNFKDETIIVIGSRSSGADIVELGVHSAKRVIQSKRGSKASRDQNSTNLELKPAITRYEITDEAEVIVHFEDGTTVDNPDRIIYATGFRYSYPFLKNAYPGITTGYAIPDLYQHTFYTKDPLLTFVGVPTDAISFRAFEYQAVLVSRFLARKTSLPPLAEQLRWSLERYRTKGDTRAFHTIDWGKKFEYLSLLTELGGGVPRIGDKGRPFPVITRDEYELHEKLIKKLIKFFSLDVNEASESFKTTV